MFKIAVKDAKKWKNAVDAIVNLIDEGPLEISKDGVTLRAMDASQIAMVSFSAPKSGFLTYEVPATAKVAVNFDNLSKILGRARPGEELEMSQEENKLVLKFISGKRKRTFKVPLMELPAGSPREPNIQHDAVVKMNGGQLKEILRDAALVSSHMTLEAKAEGFTVEVHGDSADMKIENEGAEDVQDLKVTAPARATFPLQYLDDIAKACPEAAQVTIHLKSNAPVKIEYNVEDAKLVYYLAPRIDTD